MMTFDELVDRTHASLAEKSKREVISRETVRETLDGAGVAELIQQGAAAKMARRLIVRQVWIKGEKWLPDLVYMPSLLTYSRSCWRV